MLPQYPPHLLTDTVHPAIYQELLSAMKRSHCRAHKLLLLFTHPVWPLTAQGGNAMRTIASDSDIKNLPPS